MSLRRFFFSQSDAINSALHTLSVGSELMLDDSVFHHWCRVLRATVGQQGILFDGYGGEALVELMSIHKKTATVNILEHYAINRTLDMNVSVAMVMSRGDRTDYAIQKSTELGVTSIQLITSHHGEVTLKANQVDKKLNHWQQVAISACEQCGLNYPPLIRSPIKLNAWLNGEQGYMSEPLITISESNSYYNLDNNLTTQANSDNRLETIEPLKLILAVPQISENPPVNIYDIIKSYLTTNSTINQTVSIDKFQYKRPKILILVGPEGGFSQDEHDMAIELGFTPWQVGKRVLRAETAPVAALSILNAIDLLS